MTDFATSFGPAPAFVGNDILDIGTRKARRGQRGDAMAVINGSASTLGKPGQFEIPAVHDVSIFLDDVIVVNLIFLAD